MRPKHLGSIGLVLALVLAACSSVGDAATQPGTTGGSLGPAASDPALTAIRQRGTLRVGMTTTNIPFGFIDRNGDQIGFDVDFAKKIADKLGVTLTVDTYRYPGLLPALTTDKIDMVAPG